MRGLHLLLSLRLRHSLTSGWDHVMAGGPDLVEAGVVAPLGRILEQLSRGGGARGINIDQARPPLPAASPPVLCSHAVRCLAAKGSADSLARLCDP